MPTNQTLSPRKASCGSCGAEVPIFSRASVQAVCPFCKSTLVRNDLQWETLGKMANLADDLTPIFLGLKASYKNTRFEVVGRIQLKYEQGVWNEWLLHLDNHKSAWLGEGSGLFYLTERTEVMTELPKPKDISLSLRCNLNGQSYTVTNIERASCISVEGELPLELSPGKKSLLVDLLTDSGDFATLDYSDVKPELYLGKVVRLEDFEFQNANEKTAKVISAAPLICSGCGNAVVQRNPASIYFACSSCGQVNDKSKPGKFLRAYNQTHQRMKPKIPLGTRGKLFDTDYEVIGCINRVGGGSSWDEYLLYSDAKGIRWLICSDGHWTFGEAVSNPRGRLGNVYKHFGSYQATVYSVLGEFYWQVKAKERTNCADLICPPYVISREESDNETTWTEGVYVEKNIIEETFSVKLDSPHGVGINQPSPSLFRYLVAFMVTMIAVFISGLVIHINEPQKIDIGRMSLADGQTTTLVTEPFTLKSDHALLKLYTSTYLNNEWIDIEYSLINQTTGETRIANRELSYYSGYDSDGSWSEGSNDDTANFDKVTSGTYVIEASGQGIPGVPSQIAANITATHGEMNFDNLWIVFFVLVCGPVFAGINLYYFEKRRWDNSDHPWESD